MKNELKIEERMRKRRELYITSFPNLVHALCCHEYSSCWLKLSREREREKG
jgi:hypothetical protein